MGKVIVDSSHWDKRMNKMIKEANKLLTYSMNKVGKQAKIDTHNEQRRRAPAQNTGEHANTSTFIRSITRFNVGTSKGRKYFKVGIFPGGKLKNNKFKAKFGVGLKRLGNIMTNGGTLRMPAQGLLRTSAIRKAVRSKKGTFRKQFSFVRKATKSIKFDPIKWNSIFNIRQKKWRTALKDDYARRMAEAGK